MIKSKTPLILTASILALSACAHLPLKNEGETSQTVYSANAAPAAMQAKLQNSRGLNTETLLAGEIEHSIQELSRVEQSIAAVRVGMMDVIPSLKRLETLHGEVAALNERLRKVMNDVGAMDRMTDIHAPTPITQAEPTPMAKEEPDSALQTAKAMVEDAPKTQKPAPKKTAPKPQAAPSVKQGVVSVRIGEHAGKTRLVIDVIGEVKPVFDLDNNENLMTVELPGTQWNTTKEMRNSGKNTLIAGYATDASDKGSLLAIALTRETRIIEQFSLKGSGNKPTRLVFDLKH